MKYKVGDLCEDGIGKLWLVMGVKCNKYVLQKCDNIEETWEDYIAYVDRYKHLTKVS